jgi:glycosyltransferase involved in cell wall biosynthesis
VRIALVAPYPSADAPHSGVAAYARHVFETWTQACGDLVYVTDRSVPPRLANSHIMPVWNLSWAWPWQVLRAVERLQADLVWLQHSHFLYGRNLLGFARPITLLRLLHSRGIPALIELHDVRSLKEVDRAFARREGYALPPNVLRAGLRVAVRMLTARSTIIIVHSHPARDVLLAEYGVPAERVRVVSHVLYRSHPVDRMTARRYLDLPALRNIFLFFGYAAPYKGLDVLAGALRLIDARPVREKLYLVLAAGRNPHLAGSAAYEARYAAWHAAFQSLTNARWVGFIRDDQVPAYFSACDAVVLPYTESFAASGPLSLALAYERPVILSRALRDDAADLSLLCDATPTGIADGLERFVEDADFRRRLEAESRRRRAELEAAGGYAPLFAELAGRAGAAAAP